MPTCGHRQDLIGEGDAAAVKGEAGKGWREQNSGVTQSFQAPAKCRYAPYCVSLAGLEAVLQPPPMALINATLAT